MEDECNKLVLVGNGFDLAHGLKTTYKNFLDWYICESFQVYCEKSYYNDCLLELNTKSHIIRSSQINPRTFEDVLNHFSASDYESINFHSTFFKKLIDKHKGNNWIDIECYYFRLLKAYFSNPNVTEKKEIIKQLNSDFDFLILKLSEYIETINKSLSSVPELKIDNSRFYIDVILANTNNSQVKFANFNYTETLFEKHYADSNDIIHIHGRVSDIKRNPIIFGYGDESDPAYQSIEDSGENVYLEHIKSFGYFRTGNYHKLLSYIDSAPYVVYIIGHSCGLSDRVLLNEIFEHANCQKIEIFFHKRNDGTDNFKEITQEISRHFKPQNKNIMRRRVSDKNDGNIIPQNIIA